MTTPVPITAPVNQIHTFRHETNVLAKPVSGCDVRQREDFIFIFIIFIWASVVKIESVTFPTLIYNFIIFYLSLCQCLFLVSFKKFIHIYITLSSTHI